MKITTDTKKRAIGKKKTGSTFFSVLIGIVLLSLAAVPLISTLINQTKATRMSKMRVFANQLASNMIERFRTEDFSQVTAILDSTEAGEFFVTEDELLNPDDIDATYTNLLGQFKRSLVLTPVNSRKGVLEALVTWSEEGHQREVRLSTVLVDTTFDGGKP